jgi:hypothetical protein
MHRMLILAAISCANPTSPATPHAVVPPESVLRVARPTNRLASIADMYRTGLGLEVLAKFSDHAGFDGVVLGHGGWSYHLEFTHHRDDRDEPAPSKDHLMVFFVPDPTAWAARRDQMRRAGFVEVASFNPYWDRLGVTFEDPDGYRVVIQRESAQ